MTTQKLNEVTLSTPVKTADGITVTKVTLHKPGVAALRGTSLRDLLTGDVDAWVRVLPKITEPCLSENDILSGRVDPTDFMDLVMRGMGFMAKADQLEGTASHLFLGAEDAETVPES